MRNHLAIPTLDPSVARMSPDLQVGSERVDDGTCVVTVTGDVDLASAAKLERVLDGVLADATSALVIDLSQCSFIDSSGVRILLRTHKRANGTMRALSLIPSERISTVLEITGLSRIYETHPSRTDALRDATRS
jgi:anti-anti-sigma factor